MAYGVKECAEIADAQLQVRGNPHVLGPAVPRGFVEVATHGSPPAIPADQSGRLQLADWLTGPASSLVARVTVNRIWQRLFGRGLVGSVDYFGVRGELADASGAARLSGRAVHPRWLVAETSDSRARFEPYLSPARGGR